MNIYKASSIILHPLFMQFIAFYTSIKLIPSISFVLASQLLFIYLILAFYTIVLPLISVLFLIRIKHVYSLEMMDSKERPLPLFFAAIFTALAYYRLEEILLFTPILKSEIIGSIIILMLASVISLWWKISLHMLAIGGATGIIVALNSLFGGGTEAVMLFVFLSGMLAMARLKEKAHDKSQIYLGFLLGFIIELGSVLLL